jgi:hypothetical protein
METPRPHNIQSPEAVDRLLGALILRGPLVPDGSHQIRDVGDLYAVQREVTRRAQSAGRQWQAWAHKDRTWLFTAELLFAASRERGAPVLDVRTYGEDGELKEFSLWTCNALGKWARCAE